MTGATRTGRPLRIGVTGLSGYLGRRLGPAIVAAGHEVIDLGRSAGVDLGEPATVEPVVLAAAPDALIHAAAANPGRPESSFDTVNRAGSAAVAAAAARIGARLVQVSTDVVFDGSRAPYADGAPARPCNEYGRTKAAAEDAVTALHPSAVVVRTSLIYGLHEIDRSTAGFVERLRRGEQLALFTDVLRQPVWVEALAAGLVRLATDLAEVTGTLNLAGEQAIDRATYGRRLLRHWGIDVDALGEQVTGVRASAHTTDVPLDLRLRLDRAHDLGLACPGVDEVLAAAQH